MVPPDCCRNSFFKSLSKLAMSKEAGSASRTRIFCEFCHADCVVSIAKEEAIRAGKEDKEEMYPSEEEGGVYSKEEIYVAAASCAVCKICITEGGRPDGCKMCFAKAAALHRIKQAGGDSIKAAEDSASRAGVDIIVVKAAPGARLFQSWEKIIRTEAKEGEVKPAGVVEKAIKAPEAHIKPAGVVKKIIKVLEAYFRWLQTADQPRPLRPLKDYFLQKNPQLRESTLAAAEANLSTIEWQENIMAQFLKKGYAEVEVHVDYGNKQ